MNQVKGCGEEGCCELESEMVRSIVNEAGNEWDAPLAIAPKPPHKVNLSIFE